MNSSALNVDKEQLNEEQLKDIGKAAKIAHFSETFVILSPKDVEYLLEIVNKANEQSWRLINIIKEIDGYWGDANPILRGFLRSAIKRELDLRQ